MQRMDEIDTATRDELRLLRERAYGPSADIDRDPAAAQRLAELEAQAVVTPSHPTVDPAADESPSAAAPPVLGADDAPPAASEGDARRPEGAREIPRRIVVLWALSVAAAAAAAAAFTFSLTYLPPMSTAENATQIASLESTTAVEIPAGFMGAEQSSRVYEYFGHTIFQAAGGYSFAEGGDCIVVVQTAQIPEDFDPQGGWSIESPIYSGCSAGGFPAVVQFTVDDSAPVETRAQFSDGAALQFVFDGERVGVFLDQR